MGAVDYLAFENPEVLAASIGIIVFAILFLVLNILIKNKGPSLIAAFCVAAISSWNIYTNRFYGYERTLAIFLIFVVVALFLKIMWSFVKFGKASVSS